MHSLGTAPSDRFCTFFSECTILALLHSAGGLCIYALAQKDRDDVRCVFNPPYIWSRNASCIPGKMKTVA